MCDYFPIAVRLQEYGSRWGMGLPTVMRCRDIFVRGLFLVQRCLRSGQLDGQRAAVCKTGTACCIGSLSVSAGKDGIRGPSSEAADGFGPPCFVGLLVVAELDKGAWIII